MKFGHKLTLVLLGVLALVLSLSTLWTQERQFSRALANLPLSRGDYVLIPSSR